MQAGRGEQSVSVHEPQDAQSVNVRATVFVFVRDRVREQQQQTVVQYAVPQQVCRDQSGLHKGAQRMHVHGAVDQE